MEKVVLAVNTGSASKKYAAYRGEERVASVVYEKVSDGFSASSDIGGVKKQWPTDEKSYTESAAVVARLFRDEKIFDDNPHCIGFRVVHGGAQRMPLLLTDQSSASLESTNGLAPLHNGPAMEEIRAMKNVFPGVPMVAVFDTGFHATMPDHALHYAIEKKTSDELGLVRFGFHGISCESIVWRYAGTASGVPHRLIVCHLGGGASVTAIRDGRSVDTSMGFTPLEGLVMATRGGDIDPGALMHIAATQKKTPDEMMEWLNNECGLYGLTGTADMRDVIAGDLAGDPTKKMALAMYTHRVKKYIGAYAAVLGGVDAIVLTATIGEHAPHVRGKILEGLEFLGVQIDSERNKALRDGAEGVISSESSKVRVEVMSTDELGVIARESLKLTT